MPREYITSLKVYLYEYDEEMDLKTTLEHVLPFAVVKCQWDLMPEKFSLFRSVNDGSILLPRKPKESTAPRKALLNTPPSAMKILVEKRVPKSDSKVSHLCQFTLLDTPIKFWCMQRWMRNWNILTF